MMKKNPQDSQLKLRNKKLSRRLSIQYFTRNGERYMSSSQLAIALGCKIGTIGSHKWYGVKHQGWKGGEHFKTERWTHTSGLSGKMLWTWKGMRELSGRCDMGNEEFKLWLGVAATSHTTTEKEYIALVRGAFEDFLVVEVHPAVGAHYPDLWLPEIQLVIEIDEEQHGSKAAKRKDKNRDRVLRRRLQCSVYHVRAYTNPPPPPGRVINKILKHAAQRGHFGPLSGGISDR